MAVQWPVTDRTLSRKMEEEMGLVSCLMTGIMPGYPLCGWFESPLYRVNTAGQLANTKCCCVHMSDSLPLACLPACLPPCLLTASQVYSLQVQPGDVLVVGTDGLFDNVFDFELSNVVMHSLLAGNSPQVTAEQVAGMARVRAQDRMRLSPFARAAQEEGYRYYGGKLDDITVVVSYVAKSAQGANWYHVRD